MCRCAERKTAIVGVVRKPSTALTAATFVAKTGAQDVAALTKSTASRIQNYLQRRGLRS